MRWFQGWLGTTNYLEEHFEEELHAILPLNTSFEHKVYVGECAWVACVLAFLLYVIKRSIVKDFGQYTRQGACFHIFFVEISLTLVRPGKKFHKIALNWMHTQKSIIVRNTLICYPFYMQYCRLTPWAANIPLLPLTHGHSFIGYPLATYRSVSLIYSSYDWAWLQANHTGSEWSKECIIDHLVYLALLWWKYKCWIAESCQLLLFNGSHFYIPYTYKCYSAKTLKWRWEETEGQRVRYFYHLNIK